MKNLFVLPTDKPSRLYEGVNKELKFTDHLITGKRILCQNIYITSGEKIKEGDWFIANNGVHKCIRVAENTSCPFITLNSKGEEIGHFKTWRTKIILTTDQDLIKDGVQAIDDEFLEWFVKNPSCEKVLVTNLYGDYKPVKYEYKIIIPKEKQCTCKEHDPYCCKVHGICPKCNPKEEPKPFKDMAKLTEVDWSKFKKSPFHSKKEPKQETLEEAAEKFRSNNPGTMQGGNNTKILNAFKNGAKWQQKRSYSEEELIILLKKFKKDIINSTELDDDFETLVCDIETNKWFEQFKKK